MKTKTINEICWTFFPSPTGSGMWGKALTNAYYAIVQRGFEYHLDLTTYDKNDFLNRYVTKFNSLSEAMEWAEKHDKK